MRFIRSLNIFSKRISLQTNIYFICLMVNFINKVLRCDEMQYSIDNLSRERSALIFSRQVLTAKVFLPVLAQAAYDVSEPFSNVSFLHGPSTFEAPSIDAIQEHFLYAQRRSTKRWAFEKAFGRDSRKVIGIDIDDIACRDVDLGVKLEPGQIDVYRLDLGRFESNKRINGDELLKELADRVNTLINPIRVNPYVHHDSLSRAQYRL